MRKDLNYVDLSAIAILTVSIEGREPNKTHNTTNRGTEQDASESGFDLLIPTIILGVLVVICIVILVVVVILYRRKQRQLTVAPDDKSGGLFFVLVNSAQFKI